MCGIAGYIGKKRIERSVIDNTLARMKNRGPDANGTKMFATDSLNVYLLHSRLSIIDLDPRSNQPFTIGDYTVVFNGEIYNYVELKQKLVEHGIRFATESDTEVLLRYYIEYGEKCVEYFEGMWSFAIYNAKTRELFLSRDRFAEKPLYYLETEDGLYFASEIKCVQSLSQRSLSVNENQILRYLVNGYKSLYKSGETFYTEIKELQYATSMTVDASLEKKVTRYWQPRFSPRTMSIDEAIEGTREHLIESMRIRLRSDVPISFCLSGGVDSSALVSIAVKKFGADIHTFSIIDSDERYNELDAIKETIRDLGCKNTAIHLNTDNTLERLQKLIAYHDGPLATITYFVHSFITEAVSQNGYKVVFAGHAADELYTGYYDHFNMHLHETRNSAKHSEYVRLWSEHVQKYVRNPFLKDPELYLNNEDFRGYIYLNNDVFADVLHNRFAESFTEEKFTQSLLRNRMMNELFYEGVRVILHEDDLNSMMFSVENRCPYLDSKLFDFAYSIPNELLIQQGYNKYILRQAVKGILNDTVRLEREKKGFNASINSIFDLDNEKNIDYLLAPSPVFDYVDRDKISAIFKKRPISNSYSKFIFNFINVKMFLEHSGAELCTPALQ